MPLFLFLRNLCDIEHSGKFNREQFALAVFLTMNVLRGEAPPEKELPPNMVPPSLRSKIFKLKSGRGRAFIIPLYIYIQIYTML